ncbi:MAG: hypothetical protein GC147_07470 [Porphyrobacter sp.]|nr:hypothetical protein [Porphyrobacter sp.]
MTQPPEPQESRSKWIWVVLIVVVAILVVVVAFNPSGDRSAGVEDPIVLENPGEGRGVGQTPPDTSPAPEPFAPIGDSEPEG